MEKIKNRPNDLLTIVVAKRIQIWPPKGRERIEVWQVQGLKVSDPEGTSLPVFCL
jgi:hypothetical protein